jgi:hypothetical protein
MSNNQRLYSWMLLDISAPGDAKVWERGVEAHGYLQIFSENIGNGQSPCYIAIENGHL